MTDEELARLRLIRTPGIGPVTFAQLIAALGSGWAAIEAVPDLARRGGGRPPPVISRAAAEKEVAAVQALGARHLFLGRGLYAPLLAEIETAPPVLIAQGRLDLFEPMAVAMVGARNASAAAVRYARQLAHELGARGLVVVSGLARGIDGAAHQGALGSGTIAVIAGGLDVVYPPEHADLQASIADRGLIVTEQPPGTEPRARHFPARNRIIAGLASGTVVVEAAPRSGSLITARFAAEQGREVMAVPGSPLDPRAQGCNQLIRDGATLIQSAADVVETLGPFDGAMRQPPRPYTPPPVRPADADEAVRREVTRLLGPAPVHVDELIRQSGAPPGAVQTVLLELELAGRLERRAGGRVSLAG